MGNGASSDAAEEAALARVRGLQEELAEMERVVERLRGPQPAIDALLLPLQVRVHGLAVLSDPGVRVALGPVIGRVDPQRARVLLDVDRAAPITCHVFLHDARRNGGGDDAWVPIPALAVRRECPRDRATVFILGGLLPGRRYRVVFDGVHADDVLGRQGTFTTPTPGDPRGLRCAVVSADDASGLEPGEASLWGALHREIVERDGVQLVLHLGGQVAMRRMFDKAWTLLLRDAEFTAPATTTPVDAAGSAADDAESFATAWRQLEHRAMNILRSAYRTQWSLHRAKQLVLASAANLMIWSDWDIYPSVTTSKTFAVDHTQPTIEMQVFRTVVRCARKLYHEYQRSLWDDDLDEVVERERELCEIAERALATTARIHQLSQQIPAAEADLEQQKKRREIEGARRAERHLRALEAERSRFQKQLISFNQLLNPQRGEEYVFRLGSLAILLVDMRSNRLEPGGSPCLDNAVLSNVQWDFIEHTLEQEDIKELIVCTETPVVDDLPHELRKTDNDTLYDCRTWWGANSMAQQRLLAMVFEWRLMQSDRHVLFFAGSCNTRFSMSSRTVDSRLRTSVDQWMVGPVTATTSGLRVPRNAGILFDRFNFEHTQIETIEKSILCANIKVGKGNPFTCSRVIAREVEDPAIVLLGPVIGFVNAISAVVMLEVDRVADLVCVLHNPLTGERVRVFQHFEPRQPRSFFANFLRSESYYVVSFERIARPDEHTGSFTTLPSMPTSLDIIGIRVNDATMQGMTTPGPGTSQLWSCLVNNVCSPVPFSGVDLMVQFGGGNSPEEVHDLSGLDDEYRIKEHLRTQQRLRWSMPGFRQVLAHGGRLIISDAAARSDYSHSHLIETCRQEVNMEYNNLLLPPSKRVKTMDERWANPVSTVLGSFGLFVLPLCFTSGSFVHRDTWKAFREFLTTPKLQCLLLVTLDPIVEDAVEDNEEKSRIGSHFSKTFAYGSEDLSTLFDVLLSWQSGSFEGKRARQVCLLSGHRWRTFDSVIELVNSTRPLETRVLQFAIGPIVNMKSCDDVEQVDRSVFLQGTLFNKFAYFHRFCSPFDITNSENNATDQPVHHWDYCVGQFLYLQLHVRTSMDDFVGVSGSAQIITSVPLKHTLSSRDGVFDTSVQVSLVVASGPDGWSLQLKQPPWLACILSDTLTQAEQESMTNIANLLEDKSGDVAASFTRFQPLATGLIAVCNEHQFVVHIKQAIDFFYSNLAGPSFRSQCPASPSVYVIKFAMKELLKDVSGALDIDLYSQLMSKAFSYAWLFSSRLRQTGG